MSSATFDGVRVLLLGQGPRVGVARRLLAEQGAILERCFSANVTYVVVDRTVPQHNSQVTAAKRAAVPILTTSELQKWPGMEALAAARTVPALAAAPAPVMAPAVMPPAAMPPAPMPMWRPQLSRIDPTLKGLGWGAIALCSGGLGTPVVVGVAAVKLSSNKLGWAASAYAVLPFITLFLWMMGLGGGPGSLALLGLFGWLGTMGVGAMHSYHLAHRVHEHETANTRSPLNSSDPNNARVLAALDQRRRLRAEARELFRHDPTMARQLSIGRPDKGGAFNDGGLIDVNNAPVGVLITLPGVTPDVADQIVTHRDTVGAFVSTSDLVVHTDLDPRYTSELEEMALFP